MISIQGRVRYSGIDCGQMKWKEGELAVLEDKGIAYCCMNPNVGYPKKFKLSNNIKSISEAKENRRKIIIALVDGTHIHLDHAKQPDRVGQLSQYLYQLKSMSNSKGRNIRHSSVTLNTCKTSPEYKESSHSRHSPRSLSSPRNSFTPKKINSTYTLSNATPCREKPSLGLANSTGKSIIISDDEQENLDKENEGIVRSNTPRSDRKGLFERKTGTTGSQFLSAFDDKQKAFDERKISTPLISTGTGFYSRGQQMVNYGLSNSFMSSARTNISSPVKRQPGFLSDPSHLIKKPRLGENYEGWRYKNNLTLSNHSQVSLLGFSNLGNTCYMNAILQSLFGLETFVTDILNFELIKKVPKQSLYKCLTHLLHVKRAGRSMQWEQKRDLLKKVKNAISSSAERFSGFLQHDAHEFLNQCLDQLKEDVEKVNKGSRSNSPKSENTENIPEREVPERADITSDTFTCPVTLNFEFEVLHVITCNSCNEVVTKSERFYDLSLDMPRRKDSSIAKSIQDAIDQFFRDEKIEYECNECHSKQSTVTHKFTKLPRILVLHLKRYSYNISALKNTKLGESIDIPKYLTLSLHCTGETVPPFLTEKKPNIMSPSKQEKCWGTQEDQDTKTLTARKRLYNDSTVSESNKSNFKFKKIKKVQDSDSEDEEVCRFSNKGNDVTSPNQKSEDKDIENDFKPLEELTEEEQLAKAIEMSEQVTEKRSLSFEELTCMTEEEQLAKAMELSKQESFVSSSDEGTTEGTADVSKNGRGITDETADVLENASETTEINNRDTVDGILTVHCQQNTTDKQIHSSSQTQSDNSKILCDSMNKNRTDISTDVTCTNTEMKSTVSTSKCANAISTSLKNDNCRTEESKEIKPVCGDEGDVIDLTDMPEPKSVSSPTVNSDRQHSQELNTNLSNASNSTTQGSPTKKTHPLFEKVKMSAEKCKQYTYNKIKEVFSPAKENRIPLIQENSNDNRMEKTSQDPQDGVYNVGTDEPECIGAPNFYNDDYDNDKEDKDLAAAISASMKDQEVLEQEDEDIKRAKALSLQDFENNFYDNDLMMVSDGEQEVDYSKEDLETLKLNEEDGNLPFSYQLISVVSHIGSSSSMGHYISDVYDVKKKTWLSYDDTEVDKTDEQTVRTRRRRTGYIFFYRSKDLFDDLPREQEVPHGRHSLPR
ncbi:ubiquitin carboxyl-terminal hydrolase 37-like [Glandiceps talaboti]